MLLPIRLDPRVKCAFVCSWWDYVDMINVKLCPCKEMLLLFMWAWNCFASDFIRQDSTSELSTQTVKLKWSSTSATCVLTADRDVQSVASTTLSHQRWRGNCRKTCTRIRRRTTPHSCRCCDCWCGSTGRCHGHTSWTSCRCGSWINHRRYPSIQTREACSYATPQIQRTNCTRCSTSWDYGPGCQISACSGGLVSADWADRCRASSYLLCRWIRF